MSMATTLLSNITAAGHPDLPQVIDMLARRRGRGSSHFFFFGSGGFFLALPLLILGFFGAHLMRNPDKAKSYRQRLQQVVSAMTSQPPHTSYPPHNAPAESSPGRPPRMELAPQPLFPQTPNSPQTHPTPSVNQTPGPPPPLPQQRAPRIKLTDGRPNNTGQGGLPSDQPNSPGITPSHDQQPIAPPTGEATKEIEEVRLADGRRPFELDKRVKGIVIGLAVAIGAALLFTFLGTASRTPSPVERADRDSAPVQESTPATAFAGETTATGSQPRPKTKSADIPSVDDPDLGLDVPMSRPACDGTGIVVLGSVYTPGRYREEVGRLLSMNPGASYLRTDVACPSLRQSFDGNPIYAVFRPAGKTKGAVCDAVASASPGTYGKWLDTTTDSTKPIVCDN